MKKAIITSVLTISFLIGCSFSEKKSTKPDVKPTENLTIFQKVQTLDKNTIEQELRNKTSNELNTLNSDGKTLFDIAIERGSFDIIQILLKAGASPFFPNSSGVSLYNSNKLNNVSLDKRAIGEAVLYARGSERADLLLEQNRFDDIITEVNDFQIACDGVLAFLKHEEKQSLILRLLSEAPNCKISLNSNYFKNLIESEFDSLVSKNFSNVEVFIALLKVAPKESFLIEVNHENIKFFAHPLLILKILRPYAPNEIDHIYAEIKKVSLDKDVILSCRWKDPSTQKAMRKDFLPLSTEIEASTQNIFKKNVLLKYEFYLNEEDL